MGWPGVKYQIMSPKLYFINAEMTETPWHFFALLPRLVYEDIVN